MAKKMRKFNGIDTEFACCSLPSRPIGQGARQALDIMERVGAKFVTATDCVAHYDLDPMAAINEEGHCLGLLDFAHPQLSRSPYEEEIFREFHAIASLGYLKRLPPKR